VSRSQRRGGEHGTTRVRVPEPRRASAAGPRRATAAGTRSAEPPRQHPALPDHRYQRDGRRTSGEPLRAAWDPLATHGPRVRSARGRRQHTDRGLRAFLRNYGWRAYALPLLAVLTALAVFNVGRSPLSDLRGAAATSAPGPTTQPTMLNSETPTPLVPNPDAPKFAEAKVSAELPAGGAFTERGTGAWTIVPGNGPQIGTGELFTYTVEIEDGVQLPGGANGLAQIVDTTLANPKSWIGSGKYAFQRVDSGTPDIRISLASQVTARQICGFRIPFDASCWREDRAVLNTARWERGAVAFQGNVVAYQQYVINHEVGHALGFGHKACGEHGALAPIMMQQTWGVSNDYLAALGTDNVTADGKVCVVNPWPYPTPPG
jgi:hypothetical protein